MNNEDCESLTIEIINQQEKIKTLQRIFEDIVFKK